MTETLMDILYMFAKSFKNSASPNRNCVDWIVELARAYFCGAACSYSFGNDGYAWSIAQFAYFHQFGSKMISPISRLLKDGPPEDEIEKLTLAWVRYGAFVASFQTVWLWGHVWTTVKELPLCYPGLVTIILAGGIHLLFFTPFSVLDRAYVEYREVEAQILFRRGLLLSRLWFIVRPIAEACSKPVRRILTRLGIGVRILPDVVLETPDSLYIYEKLVTVREIRLLCLTPSPISRVIRCRMEHHLLDQAPEYEAISYTWGDNSTTERILVDGRWLKVTQNAYDALYNRSFYAWTRRVWIDSVCINQNDPTEKSRQVRLMTNIYKQAYRVIVFLGDRPDAHMVHDLLAELNRRRKRYDDSVLSDRLIREYVPQEASPRWQAFLNLLDQPWFERVWILQEVVVAKKIHAIYGNKYVDWDTLVEVLRMFIGEKSAESLILLYSAENNYNARKVSNAPWFASIMTSLRQFAQEGNALPFPALLQATHAFKATDPRDKLFALIGISDPASCGPVNIDYTKDISSLYRDAARYILIEENNLSLLHKSGIGLLRNLMNLPSWTPDWSCSTTNDALNELNYTATKITKSVIRGVTVRGVQESNVVAISGKIVDTIQHLSAIREYTTNQDGVYEGEMSAKVTYSWSVEMRGLVEQYVPQVYKNGQTAEEALWRTMIGDVGVGRVRPASSDYGDYYRVWHRLLRDTDIAMSCARRNVLPPGFNTEQEFRDAGERCTRFSAVWGPFMCDRRFCVTSNGYIGIVPKGTQPEDRVCILLGANTPFVIRESTQRQEDKHYELVGDCYIHGLMDGEGLDSPVPEVPIIFC